MYFIFLHIDLTLKFKKKKKNQIEAFKRIFEGHLNFKNNMNFYN